MRKRWSSELMNATQCEKNYNREGAIVHHGYSEEGVISSVPAR